MSAQEFVPPPPWRTLAFRMVGPLGVGAFWSLNHWSFGFEVWSGGVALDLGPLALGAARIKPGDSNG